jgi:catechol 2,3-dioxygenase-like lactoylglutathione lyase family enzyme
VIDNLVPMAFVASVPRSIEFYGRLGFTVKNTVEHDGALNWAWLSSGKADLMVTTASDPVVASQQAILFYLYTRDVAKFQTEMRAKGVTVGEITRPFYMPNGEVRITDPDGYVLLVGQDE